MQDQKITGTKDWQKYSITLDYPKDAENIYVAGILSGKGEAWFDDFTLTIDGKDVQNLKEKEKPIYKANLDKEFDNGSGITFPKLNKALIDNLILLGKIWGFLKYHHPEIGKGNYNWDYELFRVLPSYLGAHNNGDRDKILLDWIEKLGEIEECTTCKETSPDAFLKPDRSWFDDFNLSRAVKDKLTYIYKNRYQGEGFYIGHDGSNHPDFRNESPYLAMPFPDEGYRLLALYKYWNMIQYFFPYKYLTDKDWSEVLRGYIPQFINANSELDYELTLLKLTGDVNDTHAQTVEGFNHVKAKRGNHYPPIRAEFIEEKLVVTGYYNPDFKSGSKIQLGDIITQINNTPVTTIVDSISPYYPASNRASKMRDMAKDILRSKNKEINIDYISNSKKRQYKLPLYPKNALDMKWYDYNGEKAYRMLEGNIGYVTLKMLTDNEVPELKESFKETKGIIIDIRNYPYASLPSTLGSYFVSRATPFVKATYGNINNPGEFNFKNAQIVPKPMETYKGKVVVLVNEVTQSKAEWTAMAFRAGDNTTIVGSCTAGADGTVSDIHLPGGITTFISGIGMYYPDGTETQRVGIVPDVEVRPSIEGIRQGRDEVLEKAIKIINKKTF